LTPEQEYALYIDPDNQVPQGPPVRRKVRLSEPLPVRLPEELLQQVGERAGADNRSVTAVDPGKTLALGGQDSGLSQVGGRTDVLLTRQDIGQDSRSR
jgi:hypothetical protein